MGGRIAFLVTALMANGLNLWQMVPDPKAHAGAALIAKAVRELVGDCQAEGFDPRTVYKLFITLKNEARWNPFQGLLPDFHKNRIFMTTILELQLADTLYMLQRSLEKGARPLSYRSLYPRLEELQAVLRRQSALNIDQLSDILFQCLKLAEFLQDDRRTTLLRTAFEATEYLKIGNLQIGAKLDRKLHVISRNADVLFYLNIQLGWELGLENPNAKDLLRFILKRLDRNPEYKYPKSSKESVRTQRIGKQLLEHCQSLKDSMNS
jgi:hypothetical protein